MTSSCVRMHEPLRVLMLVPYHDRQRWLGLPLGAPSLERSWNT